MKNAVSLIAEVDHWTCSEPAEFSSLSDTVFEIQILMLAYRPTPISYRGTFHWRTPTKFVYFWFPRSTYVWYTYASVSRHISLIGWVQIMNSIKSNPTTSLLRRMGERRYSSYTFTTSALDGGEWSSSRPGRVLPLGKEAPVPIVQEAGWAPEPVWTQRLEEKSFSCAGNRTWIARSFSPSPSTVLTELPGSMNPISLCNFSSLTFSHFFRFRCCYQYFVLKDLQCM
jgi:hypothetical protein